MKALAVGKGEAAPGDRNVQTVSRPLWHPESGPCQACYNSVENGTTACLLITLAHRDGIWITGQPFLGIARNWSVERRGLACLELSGGQLLQGGAAVSLLFMQYVPYSV